MSKGALALLISLLAACSAPSEEPAGFGSGGNAVLSPEADLYDMLGADVARWNQAAGLSLSVAPGGIPVVYVPQAYAHDDFGNPFEVCAITHVYMGTQRVESIEVTDHVMAGCHEQDVSILHELEHVITPSSNHTKKGLFATAILSDKIDEVSLVEACSHADCNTFQPEL